MEVNSSQDYDEYDNDRNDFSHRQEALSRSDGFSNSRQDLVVEEAGVPGENHPPWASNC
jgi:hypothetical protein